MKDLLAKLKALYGKTFSEDGFFEELKAFIEEKAATMVEAAVAPLKAKIAELEPLPAKVAELTPLAADGKAYRDGLVVTYVTSKAKLGEVSEKPEDQDALKKSRGWISIDFLKAEVGHLASAWRKSSRPGRSLTGEDPESATSPRAPAARRRIRS